MMEIKIPHTKNETFAQLDAMLSEKEKSELANGDAIEYHFSLGMCSHGDCPPVSDAKDPKSRRAYLTTIREYFARVKMFMDLITYDDKTERE